VNLSFALRRLRAASRAWEGARAVGAEVTMVGYSKGPMCIQTRRMIRYAKESGNDLQNRWSRSVAMSRLRHVTGLLVQTQQQRHRNR